jgi:hypothetical protein
MSGSPGDPEDRLAGILALASRNVEAHLANAEIARERQAQEELHDLVVPYEVLLRPDGGFAQLADEVLPRMTYYLRGKKLRPPKATGAFLALFVGDTLYFLEARSFYDGMRDALGWSEATLAEHVERWQKEIP